MARDGTFAVSFRIILFINLTSGLLFLKLINISFSFAPTLQGSDSEFQTDPFCITNAQYDGHLISPMDIKYENYNK